jgi:hypothetical protein
MVFIIVVVLLWFLLLLSRAVDLSDAVWLKLVLLPVACPSMKDFAYRIAWFVRLIIRSKASHLACRQ